MDCPKRTASAGLPDDSLVEILERVPARTVSLSKCVAKAWRDLIEDPLHRKKLPQTLEGLFFIDRENYGPDISFTNLLSTSPPLQIDPSLSFLKKSPGIQILRFLDSCNGLLLFEHKEKPWPYSLLGYVVCNPATKQWVEVPRPLLRLYVRRPETYNYLVFDPSVSSHFHLVQFEWQFSGLLVYDDEDDDGEEQFSPTSVGLYSSETGKWTDKQSQRSPIQSDGDKHDLEGWRLQGSSVLRSSCCAVLNSMLHFTTSDQIAVVDVHGVTENIIPVPKMAERSHWPNPGYVAQSQGRLHYINQSDAQLSIWVLENYEKQDWVLKHTVSFTKLFRKRSRTGSKNHYSVVAMHPDGNVVFIVKDRNQKLISYDMDHKTVSVIGTLENDTSAMHIVPYVPCFLEPLALPNKQ